MGLKKAFEELTGLKFPPSSHDLLEARWEIEDRRQERALKIIQLFSSAAAGNMDKVGELIAQGVDVNAEGSKALRGAASNGHTETALLLIARGASARMRGTDGRNAIDCALDAGHTDTASAIEVAIQKNGGTPRLPST